MDLPIILFQITFILSVGTMSNNWHGLDWKQKLCRIYWNLENFSFNKNGYTRFYWYHFLCQRVCNVGTESVKKLYRTIEMRFELILYAICSVFNVWNTFFNHVGYFFLFLAIFKMYNIIFINLKFKLLPTCCERNKIDF